MRMFFANDTYLEDLQMFFIVGISCYTVVHNVNSAFTYFKCILYYSDNIINRSIVFD